MNKKIAKYLLALVTIALAGGGCEVNDFNDKLDGFEGKPQPGNVQTITRTLSAADYTAIASNKDNQAIAKELGDDAIAALKAIGVNKFIDGDDSKLYLPAFLTSIYSYLDNRSAIEVSFINKNKGSEVLEKGLNGQYTLVEADYDAVWGTNQTTPFFTPEKSAAEFLPKILKAKKTGAVAGDHSLVTYSYSYEEPKPDTQAASYRLNTRADQPVAITQIKDLSYDKTTVYTIEATVVSTYAKGLIIKDDTGVILLYSGVDAGCGLGDKIQVTGTTEKYFGVQQVQSKNMVTKLVAPVSAAFAYPADATVITPANIPTTIPAVDGNAHSFDPFVYISLTGTVAKNGTDYDVKVKDASGTDWPCRITYPTVMMQLESLVGKEVNVAGYLISTNTSKKIFGIMATTLVEAGKTAPTAIGVANSEKGKTVTCQGQVVALNGKGFLLCDGTGTTLVLKNDTGFAIGDIVTVSGTTNLNYSMPEIKTITAATKVTSANVVRPNLKAVTGVELTDYYGNKPYYNYVKYEGKLTKTTNDKGTFYEIHDIEGFAKYGSISAPLADQVTLLDKLANRKVIITGYLSGTNTSTGYFSTILLSVEPKDKYVTETRYDVYTYNGSAWETVAAKDALAINEADYNEMGISNMYFDSANSADKYVVAFLNKKFPYAQADQLTTLFYNYKEAAGNPYAMGGVYKFDGAAWWQNQATQQYVKSSGKWQFNPSPTIVVAPDKSAFSAKIYQACVDYVIAEKNAAYTTKDGARLDKSEFYCGCASDYTNLNWRINTLPWYYWKVAEGEEAVKVYEDWSSTDKAKQKASYAAFYKEIEKRFGEVMSAGLSELYPNATMIPDVEIIYTVQMMLYTQHIANTTGRVTHAFEFKLVGTGQFEYKRMYALDPKFELMNEDNFK